LRRTFTGAWIETLVSLVKLRFKPVAPSRVRELKLEKIGGLKND